MLNPQKGNMYGFVSHTWNAVKGICSHGCEYCYMKRFGHLKDVRLEPKEFQDDLGAGNFIFVGSSTDMFAEDVPSEWITAVMEHLGRYPDNGYLLQSKNPSRFMEFIDDLPPGAVLCTTVETNRENDLGCAPSRQERLQAMHALKQHISVHITLEPIMDFDLEEFSEQIISLRPDQVNIGSNTSSVKIPEPSKEKTLALIKILKENDINVHEKDNLKRLIR